ncbi:hypothetical protein R5W24_004085 [Gemmata sp. JC717]|uniref:Recombination-associated protein RdgC n=1 Tax=Gemmata algarum TaxID=2975278 RepID=A0ABU5F6V9_9BACT|nr:hypothetical protein [Gemmata algarum]MDY3554953.1 hypothetical protein [Gemmata algarum]MDY3562048.1 hypothetical protein [Gemmata algarum]
MGFFTGRVTFLRFAVGGPAPRFFDDEHLDRLREHAAGRQALAAADGIETGWAAGKSVLDTEFDLAKNVINDTLHFDLRVDTDRLPGDLLKAYYETDLAALAKENPSGFASARQKREAKEGARNRLEAEAKDGRFKRRKCTPVLWDRAANEVLFGATSATHADRLSDLFERTFGLPLEPLTAGRQAERAASALGLTGAAEMPSEFVPGNEGEVAWVPGGGAADFLGNEYLLWLWFLTDRETDTVTAADGSDITLMPARTLTLECPRGVTGSETIASDGPTRLPEARRAVQAGKLPRKMGLTMVRHGLQYELTLHAETLAVGSCKMPDLPEDVTEARAKLDERATQVRELVETLDLLYAHFLTVRLSPGWAEELERVRGWLAHAESRAA